MGTRDIREGKWMMKRREKVIEKEAKDGDRQRAERRQGRSIKKRKCESKYSVKMREKVIEKKSKGRRQRGSRENRKKM